MIRPFGTESISEVPQCARLALVETAEHVRTVLRGPDRDAVDIFVALEPEAAWALHEADRRYLRLEDGYSQAKLCDLAEAERAVAEQQSWAEWVDEELWTRVPSFESVGFSPARLYLYFLKILFDSLSIRANTLEGALRTWRPTFILYPGAQLADQVFGSDLSFRESLYPVVLREVAKRLHIDARLPREQVTAPAASKAALGKRSPTVQRRWYPFLRNLQCWIRTLMNGSRFSGGDVVIASDQYDLRSVWSTARKHGIPMTSWELIVNRFRPLRNSVPVKDAQSWMAECWEEITSDSRFRRVVRPRGYDLWSAVEGRMHWWWHVLVPQQWAVYQAVRRSFQRRRPRAVVVSGLGDHLDRAVFSALQSLDVPAHIYQHGGFVGWCECPPWDCNDLWNAQHILTYGPGVSEYFERRRARYFGRRAEPVSVGSSRLDRLRSELASTQRRTKMRPIVLLVPNVIPYNQNYLDCGNLPDVTEAELQLAMVSAAREFPQYDFVLKPFHDQTDTPAVRLARQRGSNCRIQPKTKLPVLMASASLIVLDFPSTALLEALLTAQPVLVLADPRYIRMLPKAKAALAKRVELAETPEEFLYAYRRRLRTEDMSRISQPDESFLAMYGTHLNDGRSAERALAAILDRQTLS